MERLTWRDGDTVFFRKDGGFVPPMNMSSQEVRQVLLKLADYEDEAEQREQGCDFCNNIHCAVCRNQSLGARRDGYKSVKGMDKRINEIATHFGFNCQLNQLSEECAEV